ncbi:hypothetical protein GGI24_006557, partial [Coemansia furcata]
ALKQRDAAAVEREGVSAQLGEVLATCDALEKESGAVGLRLAAAEQTLGNAQQEKQRLTEANARLVAEIDELRRLIDEKADQGTRESEMRRMREGELSALRSELNDATSELEDFRRAHIEAEEALRGEMEQLRRERDQAAQARAAAEAHAQAMEAQLLEHAARMEEMEAGNMLLESQLTEASAKSRSIESEYADTRQTHDAAAAEVVALKQLVAGVEAQRDEHHAELGEAQQALAAAQRTAQELQARLDENEAQRDEYQQRITTQSQEYEELKDKYDHDAEAHREAAAERDRLAAELADARLANEREGSHALALEQANAEFKAQYDALTAEVAQARATAADLQARLEAEAASHGMAQEVRARGEAQHREIQDKLLQEVAAKEAQAEDARRQLLGE